jgi:hypothetical protein
MRKLTIVDIVGLREIVSLRTIWLLAFAAGATAVAWAVFESIAPLHPRVGTAILATTVPLGYQLSVFPAFGAFAGALALDVARREPLRTWLPRVALLAITGTAAVARLAGALPLSGHALFLFAALAYSMTPPADRDAHWSLGACIPALLVVGWCKLVVWGDPLWFGASALLGCVVGVALARLARS